MQFRGKRAFIHIHKRRGVHIAGCYLAGTPVPQVAIHRFVKRDWAAIPACLPGRSMSRPRTRLKVGPRVADLLAMLMSVFGPSSWRHPPDSSQWAIWLRLMPQEAMETNAHLAPAGNTPKGARLFGLRTRLNPRIAPFHSRISCIHAHVYAAACGAARISATSKNENAIIFGNSEVLGLQSATRRRGDLRIP